MSRGSLFVISDTHLGLRNGVNCEPEILGQFLNWLIRLRNGELNADEAKIKLGSYDRSGRNRREKVLKPPDKLLMLGDILELWEATDRAIELNSRPIFNLLEKLNCEKIYILGNHDYDLLSMSGVYPSGEQRLSILKEYYPSQPDQRGKNEDKKISTLRIGNRDYLFLHGYQFDKSFGFPLHPWMHFGGLRSAALAFGGYAELFIILLFSGLAVLILRYVAALYSPISFLNGVLSFLSFLANPILLLLWTILAGPRIFYSYGRRIWSRVFGTRYNREASVKGIRTWWKTLSGRRDLSDRNLRIVFGHTHTIQTHEFTEPSTQKRKRATKKRTGEGRTLFTAINVPSWVKDKSKRQKYAQVLRAACLYIDDDDELFVGWNWAKKKPFLIPIEAVDEKNTAEQRDNQFVSKETGKKLLAIGWPKNLVHDWTGVNTVKK